MSSLIDKIHCQFVYSRDAAVAYARCENVANVMVLVGSGCLAAIPRPYPSHLYEYVPLAVLMVAFLGTVCGMSKRSCSEFSEQCRRLSVFAATWGASSANMWRRPPIPAAVARFSLLFLPSRTGCRPDRRRCQCDTCENPLESIVEFYQIGKPDAADTTGATTRGASTAMRIAQVYGYSAFLTSRLLRDAEGRERIRVILVWAVTVGVFYAAAVEAQSNPKTWQLVVELLVRGFILYFALRAIAGAIAAADARRGCEEVIEQLRLAVAQYQGGAGGDLMFYRVASEFDARHASFPPESVRVSRKDRESIENDWKGQWKEWHDALAKAEAPHSGRKNPRLAN